MFADRAEAGKMLAAALARYRGDDTVVIALPRGGVVLGAQVARALGCPLGIIAVRKIGHPASPEYAIGAVDEFGNRTMNEAEVASVEKVWLEKEIERERSEALRRGTVYRSGKAPLELKKKTVLIVDDGIATGLTMLCAARAARERAARAIIVATPVSAPEAVHELRTAADDVVVLEPPEDFLGAIGAHYVAFPQVSDREVLSLMRQGSE